MVGVGEHEAITHAPQLVGRHCLDRGTGPDRHKARRGDFAVGRNQTSHASVAVGCPDFEAQRRFHQMISIASP